MIREKYNPLPEITAGVFALTMGAYFLSSLMSTMGSVIDSFIIGHTMKTAEIGALSLTSPVWFVLGIIYSILIMGSQPLCAQELSKGDREKAGRIYSTALFTGISLSTALTVLILLFSSSAAGLLGAHPGMDEFLPCRNYLIGASVGFPAVCTISILSMGINLEGARRWTVRSAAAVSVTNIVMDLMIGYFHGDMFMIGLTTSISYYAGAAVLVLYYCLNRDNLIKPSLSRMYFPLTGRIALLGMPMGVSRITTAYKSFFLNRILASGASLAGLAAYNVQVQLSYLTNSLFMSIALTMSMMLCLYYPEENRRGLKYTVLIALCYEAVFGLGITLLLRSQSVKELLSWFYLGENMESYFAAQTAIHYFALGLTGQAMSVLFANYLNSTGRTLTADLVYILCDAVLVTVMVAAKLYALPAGISDALRSGTIFAAVSRAQLTMFGMIPAMIVLINWLQKAKPGAIADVLLMLPDGYGVSKEDELTASPRSLQQVNAFSQEAYDFCLKHGAGKKEAGYISLAAEEMASNIFKHGFTDRGHHTMELRVIHKKDAICLRIRDNSHIFDPIKKMAMVADIDDPSRYIGLRMVMRLADEVTYTPTLKLNNLLIRIRLAGQDSKAAAAAA